LVSDWVAPAGRFSSGGCSARTRFLPKSFGSATGRSHAKRWCDERFRGARCFSPGVQTTTGANSTGPAPGGPGGIHLATLKPRLTSSPAPIPRADACRPAPRRGPILSPAECESGLVPQGFSAPLGAGEGFFIPSLQIAFSAKKLPRASSPGIAGSRSSRPRPLARPAVERLRRPTANRACHRREKPPTRVYFLRTVTR
jgi:hypothetical protein